ncbi:MAG: hypothetical protein WAM60_01750 [Candidatus Promineifilaceae bacterium]
MLFEKISERATKPIEVEGEAFAPSDAVSVQLEISADQMDGYAFFDDVSFDRFDPGDTIYRSTYGLAGQPIAIQVTTVPTDTNDGLYFVHTDQLGSISAMSDATGQLVGNIVRFDPFGDYRPGSGANDLTDQGYTGHKHNDYIKLIYMNARWYDAYMTLRGWVLTGLPNDPASLGPTQWVASNGATSLYKFPEDPLHHLVVSMSLYVAGNNTWDLVETQDKLITGPIPPIEWMFIKNIKDYLP